MNLWRSGEEMSNVFFSFLEQMDFHLPDGHDLLAKSIKTYASNNAHAHKHNFSNTNIHKPQPQSHTHSPHQTFKITQIHTSASTLTHTQTLTNNHSTHTNKQTPKYTHPHPHTQHTLHTHPHTHPSKHPHTAIHVHTRRSLSSTAVNKHQSDSLNAIFKSISLMDYEIFVNSSCKFPHETVVILLLRQRRKALIFACNLNFVLCGRPHGGLFAYGRLL